MSISELSLATDITADIQKPIGNLDVNGRHDAGHFGIDSNGHGYFDTSGASPGETAALGWDPSVGAFCIATPPDIYEIRELMFSVVAPKWTPQRLPFLGNEAQWFWMAQPRGNTEQRRLPSVGAEHMAAIRQRIPKARGMGVSLLVSELTGRVEPGCTGRDAMPRHGGVRVAGCVGRPRWPR